MIVMFVLKNKRAEEEREREKRKDGMLERSKITRINLQSSELKQTTTEIERKI